jgi:hypothetical protein
VFENPGRDVLDDVRRDAAVDLDGLVRDRQALPLEEEVVELGVEVEFDGATLLTMTPMRSRGKVEYRGIFGTVGRTPRKIKPRAHLLSAFIHLPIKSLSLFNELPLPADL